MMLLKYLILCLALVVLQGCANKYEGVSITPEESKACKAEGCAVYTLQELMEAARKIFNEGVAHGKTWL